MLPMLQVYGMLFGFIALITGSLVLLIFLEEYENKRKR